MLLRVLFHSIVVVLLTILTQIGGIAWLVALLARRRLITFAAVYAFLSVASLWIAPQLGRVPLPCLSDNDLRMRSVLYCALNRQYVTPAMKQTVEDLADHMSTRYPGTVTIALDGNFPFLNGFPMIPHLSHNDGRKLDLAFFYEDEKGHYLPGKSPSPIGYFAFENGSTNCTSEWFTLRWDLVWLQPLWRDDRVEETRTRAAIIWLASDQRVEKILLEPHLQNTLRVGYDKVRFQGCHAARHDDHIHFQIR